MIEQDRRGGQPLGLQGGVAVLEVLGLQPVEAVVTEVRDQVVADLRRLSTGPGGATPSGRRRRGSDGGRPPAFDAEDYKGRNVVERAVNHFKNWRGLPTRYDKHALVVRGGLVLAAIFAGSHDYGNTP